MNRRPVAATLAIVSFLLLSPASQGAEGPRIISWSNSKTEDSKTVLAVKPGEKITFSVKAEDADAFQWRVDGQTVPGIKDASFKWTVPGKKGLWKIMAVTTNSLRRARAKEQSAFLNEWVRVRKDRRGKALPEEKKAFIRAVTEYGLYPLQARKEWIVSTFVKEVKPGESIQRAIDSVPPEGGIVELAPGAHEITGEIYPPSTFRYKRSSAVTYSIGIRRNNVAVCGGRRSVVRLHDKRVNHCFFIPDLEDADPDLYIENVTFRGFTAASTYRSGRTSVIAATHVKNLTVEEINDTSHARSLAGAGCSQGHHRYNSGVFLRNNTGLHGSDLGAMFSTNVHIEGNTLTGGTYAVNVNRNNRNWYVIGNHVTSGAHALHIHGPITNLYIQGNTFIGRNPLHQDTAGAITNGIIEGNVFRNGKRFGISLAASCPLQNYLIRNNRIYNNGGPGVHVRFWRNDVPRETSIINNVIYNNAGDGIRLDDATWALNVRNNIIACNKGYGINRIKGNIRLGYNNIWGNGKGGYSGCAKGTGDFSDDPLFADPLKGDFRLKSAAGRWEPASNKWVRDNANSSCIDAGEPNDRYGHEPAPNGKRINVGAYGNTPQASKSGRK